MPEFEVLEVGGPEPAPSRRRWYRMALAAGLLVVGGLVLHGALTRPAVPEPRPSSAVGESATPTFSPDPGLARVAGSAMPAYPGTVAPVGYRDAGTGFVGIFGDTPGRRIQLDLACAGAGRVLVAAYPDGAHPEATGPALATAMVPCSDRPAATMVTLSAPLDGRYQLVLVAGPATGVLAWRVLRW